MTQPDHNFHGRNKSKAEHISDIEEMKKKSYEQMTLERLLKQRDTMVRNLDTIREVIKVKTQPKKRSHVRNGNKMEGTKIKNTLINKIAEIVCQYYGQDIKEVYTLNNDGKMSRQREFVISRQMIHYLSKIHTRLSLKEIGSQTGGADHSTVIHSIETIQDLLQFNVNHRKEFNEIQMRIDMSDHLDVIKDFQFIQL